MTHARTQALLRQAPTPAQFDAHLGKMTSKDRTQVHANYNGLRRASFSRTGPVHHRLNHAQIDDVENFLLAPPDYQGKLERTTRSAIVFVVALLLSPLVVYLG